MANTLYVGTKKGFFKLGRRDSSWQVESRSLDGVEVSDLLLQSGKNRLWAATRDEGALYSTDGGNSWESVGTAEMAKLHAINENPNNPDELYAGAEPAGIFRSADGGKSWARLGDLKSCAGAAKWFYPFPGVGTHIRSVAPSLDDPKTVFGAVQVGGIVRSTDGGDTWSDFRNLDLDIHTVRIHPKERRTVYAAGGHDGLFRSRDGGDTWQHLSEGLGRFGYDFVFHPERPELMFFAAGIGEPPHWANHPEGARAQVYRSEDGGDTWATMDVGNPQGTKLMLYEFALDPDTPERMWLVAGDEVSRVFEGPGKMSDKIYGSVDHGAIYQSGDSGCSWRLVNDAIPSGRAIIAVS
jgi:Sortilin, neurotensin receptor 3,